MRIVGICLGGGGVSHFPRIAVAAAATTPSATTTATTSAIAASFTLTPAAVLAVGFPLLIASIVFPGRLDRDLPLENLLSGQIIDRLLGIGLIHKVDESVSHRPTGARVAGDRDTLATNKSVSSEEQAAIS